MTEDSLQHLPLDDLLDLMEKSSAELSEAKERDEDYKLIAIKKEQVAILQKVIVAKRAEFPPLK